MGSLPTLWAEILYGWIKGKAADWGFAQNLFILSQLGPVFGYFLVGSLV
jgi:hypothetical protein